MWKWRPNCPKCELAEYWPWAAVWSIFTENVFTWLQKIRGDVNDLDGEDVCSPGHWCDLWTGQGQSCGRQCVWVVCVWIILSSLFSVKWHYSIEHTLVCVCVFYYSCIKPVYHIRWKLFSKLGDRAWWVGPLTNVNHEGLCGCCVIFCRWHPDLLFIIYLSLCLCVVWFKNLLNVCWFNGRKRWDTLWILCIYAIIMNNVHATICGSHPDLTKSINK